MEMREGSLEAGYDGPMDQEYRSYTAAKSKAYLSHIRSLIHTVRQLQSELEELEGLASGLSGIDYTRPLVRTSPSQDRLERVVIRLESVRDEYAAELAGYLEEQNEAHACIRLAGQPYAALLTERYLHGRTWADTADAIHYQETYARTELHEEALARLYPHLPAPWRDPTHRAV